MGPTLEFPHLTESWAQPGERVDGGHNPVPGGENPGLWRPFSVPGRGGLAKWNQSFNATNIQLFLLQWVAWSSSQQAFDASRALVWVPTLRSLVSPHRHPSLPERGRWCTWGRHQRLSVLCPCSPAVHKHCGGSPCRETGQYLRSPKHVLFWFCCGSMKDTENREGNKYPPPSLPPGDPRVFGIRWDSA